MVTTLGLTWVTAEEQRGGGVPGGTWPRPRRAAVGRSPPSWGGVATKRKKNQSTYEGSRAGDGPRECIACIGRAWTQRTAPPVGRAFGKGRNGTACRHTAAARVGRIQSPLLGRPARRARAPQGTGSHGNVDQSGLGGPRTRDGLTAVTHLVPRQCDAFCVGAGRGKRQCRVPVKSSAGASGVVERAPQGESCTAAITVAASGRG